MKTTMKNTMYKLVKVADVRLNMDKFERGEISYTRAVELINEAANKEMQIILKNMNNAKLNNMDKINTTLEIPEGSKATIQGKEIDGKNYIVVEGNPETLQIEDLGTIGNCAGCLVEIYMNRCGNFRNDKNMILCPLCYINYLVLKGMEMYFTDIEKLKQ